MSDPNDLIGPLEVLEDLMLTAESEAVRVTAASKLAEYRHRKLQPDAEEVQKVTFSVTLAPPATPHHLSLVKK